MTIEIETGRSGNSAITRWAPKARRHGEPAEWAELPKPGDQTAEDLVFPPISPPPVRWPRIFPGL